MENASKALIMAAGVLIGILILSLAVYLFMSFGASSKEIYNQIAEQQLAEYNAQYNIYEGRNDITIYDIITLANLAKENNEYYKDFSNHENIYDVKVKFKGNSEQYSNLEEQTDSIKQKLINTYSAVDSSGELKYSFKCTELTYHADNGGRIATIKFEINK